MGDQAPKDRSADSAPSGVRVPYGTWRPKTAFFTVCPRIQGAMQPLDRPDSQNDLDRPNASSASDDGLVGKLLPELATAAVLLGLWLNLLPPWLDLPLEDTVDWLVGIEAATLLFMVALVDVATRLKRAPPWWLGLVLIIGLVIVFPEIIALVVTAWQMGLWVFLPLLWSVAERLRELWTLPTARALEKMRRRALSWVRLSTGVVLFGVCVLVLLVRSVLSPDHDPGESIAHLALPLLCLFYLIAVFDAWRVHRPAFAARPRSLWPFFDDGASASIHPGE